MTKLDKTFTKKEVADKLHISIRTLENYIKTGKLKAKKLVNSRVLITEEDLNKFIDKYVKNI